MINFYYGRTNRWTDKQTDTLTNTNFIWTNKQTDRQTDNFPAQILQIKICSYSIYFLISGSIWTAIVFMDSLYHSRCFKNIISYFEACIWRVTDFYFGRTNRRTDKQLDRQNSQILIQIMKIEYCNWKVSKPAGFIQIYDIFSNL